MKTSFSSRNIATNTINRLLASAVRARLDPTLYAKSAVKSPCNDLGCEEQYLVLRTRLTRKQEGEIEEAQDPAIHIGIVGSGDGVIKSGEHRDSVAKAKGIIAFEMEGAGIMEEIHVRGG